MVERWEWGHWESGGKGGRIHGGEEIEVRCADNGSQKVEVKGVRWWKW